MLLVFSLLGKLLLACFSLVGLYLAAAFTVPLIPSKGRSGAGMADRLVYVASNGVHVDLVLPCASIPQTLLHQLRVSEGVRYLAFGWGDKGFYLDTPTWAELKLSTAVRAMLIKSPTAMHVTDYRKIADNWMPLSLRKDQFTDLLAYLQDGFQVDIDGQVIEIEGVGYTADDRFFEANGSYHAFTTCNAWANRGLKRAGVRTAIWSPHDRGMLRYYRNATTQHALEAAPATSR